MPFGLIPESRSPSAESAVGIGNSHILIKQDTKRGTNYVLVVSPQGWNRTSVYVARGKALRIQAGGKVNIDLAGLVRALDARSRAEANAKAHAPPGADLAWEDKFTDREIHDMVPAWSWTDPDGVKGEAMIRANKSRLDRRVMKDAGYGTLIG